MSSSVSLPMCKLCKVLLPNTIKMKDHIKCQHGKISEDVSTWMDIINFSSLSVPLERTDTPVMALNAEEMPIENVIVKEEFEDESLGQDPLAFQTEDANSPASNQFQVPDKPDQPSETQPRHPCPLCKRVCRTYSGVTSHLRLSHGMSFLNQCPIPGCVSWNNRPKKNCGRFLFQLESHLKSVHPQYSFNIVQDIASIMPSSFQEPVKFAANQRSKIATPAESRQNKPLFCRLCHRTDFKFLSRIRSHTKMMHETSKEISCITCLEFFVSYEALLFHSLSIHCRPFWDSLIWSERDTLERRLVYSEPGTEVKCPKLNCSTQTFSTIADFLSHVNSEAHSQQQLNISPARPAASSSISKNHITTGQNKVPKTTFAEMARKIGTIAPAPRPARPMLNPPLFCRICNRNFPQYKTLSQIRAHVNHICDKSRRVVELACELCAKSCKFEAHLQFHILSNHCSHFWDSIPSWKVKDSLEKALVYSQEKDSRVNCPHCPSPGPEFQGIAEFMDHINTNHAPFTPVSHPDELEILGLPSEIKEEPLELF